MATTVQAMMLKLTLAVDPTVKATGILFTSATVGTTDGDAFSAQRLLDVYNFARKALFIGADGIMSPQERALKFGSIIKNGTLTFTTSSADATAPKPSDYLKWVRIEDPSTGVEITILDDTFLPTVRAKLNPHYVQTTTKNKFLFEQGINFYGFNDPAGTFANAATARLTYYAIADFIISDITGGSTIETLPEDMLPILMELSIAWANGQGETEVNALAKALLAQKKG